MSSSAALQNLIVVKNKKHGNRILKHHLVFMRFLGVCVCVPQFLVCSHSVFGCQQRCQSSVKARWGALAVCSIGRNGLLPFFFFPFAVNITCSVKPPSSGWETAPEFQQTSFTKISERSPRLPSAADFSQSDFKTTRRY